MNSHEMFEKGRELLRDGNSLAALSYFERAYSIEKIRGIQSYMGLCYALERAQINEGIRLCNEALEEEPENPFHYLNLAKIYVKANRKNEAFDILRHGLSYGDSEDIRKFLDSLGSRRAPFFPFLPRKHLLNKYAGLLLRKLRLG